MLKLKFPQRSTTIYLENKINQNFITLSEAFEFLPASSKEAFIPWLWCYNVYKYENIPNFLITLQNENPRSHANE